MSYIYSGLLIISCISLLGWMVYQDHKNWKDFIQLIRERNLIYYPYPYTVSGGSGNTETYIIYTNGI